MTPRSPGASGAQFVAHRVVPVTRGRQGPVADSEGEDEEEQAERGRYYVRSLERGIAILRAFAGGRTRLTLAEIASAAAMSRAAARRFLLTYQDLGYVAVEDGRFSLRPRVLEVGVAYLAGLSLREMALPHLERLCEAVGETTSLAILDGMDIVYIARIPTRRILPGVVTVGTRFPAYATSLGRVLLAGLDATSLEHYYAKVEVAPFTNRTVRSVDELRRVVDAVRAKGWAIVDQELEIGLLSVATPIHDRTGATVAAVNISAHASRHSLAEANENLLPAIQKTANAIDTAVTIALH